MIFIILIHLILIGSLQSVQGFCPGGCSCNDSIHVVHCSDAGLDIIPGTLIDAAFQFYVQLIVSDFSHNELDSLADRCFASSPQLKELKLDNNRLEHLNNLTFSGLKSLETLSIRKNLIQNLTVSIFESLSQLNTLDLGENPIHFIDGSAFESLTQLRDLRLDHNALTIIPPFPMALSKNLIKMKLSYNKDLRSRLENIPFSAFHGLSSLKTLDISSNKIKVIPRFSHSLANLRELFIGGSNLYSDIPSFGFQGLNGLRLLDITQSENLRVIRTRAIYGNPSLKTLDLSEAQIPEMRFEDEAFFINRNSSIEKLQLIFRSMGLRSINEGSVANWTTKVESIDLKDNPLKCDCRLNWLVNFISKTYTTSHAICSNGKPLNLKKQSYMSGCA
ncbi:unnamed protein product [Lepeophtheirus salmonis]|uniref:(salmon louse) hypothetical protein n=1 Tax=Lepeophtheirus salmonis TaxID=72036 RepID=A0A7R8CPT2_LEPSM|nr:unnamed protein product [Lepeophtheirus salmonis]CAF2851612.1 unnamed protein product [Lepeophtheirus salmonis]